MEKLDTRLHILSIAQELIQTRGYNAFSYQDLADELQIKKASIHHHFPSKEDLGAEILEAALERFQKWTQSLSPSLTPSEKLDLYIESSNICNKTKDRICLGGITNAEWNTLPKKMKGTAEALRNVRRQWVIATITAGQKSGEFKRTRSAEDLTLLLSSALQGALQIARVQGDGKIYEIVAQQMKEMIKK